MCCRRAERPSSAQIRPGRRAAFLLRAADMAGTRGGRRRRTVRQAHVLAEAGAAPTRGQTGQDRTSGPEPTGGTGMVDYEIYRARADEARAQALAATTSPFTIEVRFLGGLTQPQQDA